MIESGDYRVYLDEAYAIIKSNGLRYDPESSIAFVAPDRWEDDYPLFSTEDYE